MREAMRSIETGAGCTPTDVVLGYITSTPLNGTALVSCSTLEQLEDVLKSADYVLAGEPISQFDE